MQIFIGIEASPLLSELPDFEEFLQLAATPLLVHENIYIYNDQKIADIASGLLSEAELHEETHHLIKTEGSAREDFYDYGFQAGVDTFLFAYDLSAFRFTGGSEVQTEMALLQLEEHLVFTTVEGIYFTIDHYTDLVLGIVKAYEVKVEFLDLDK
ncbi:hypothetical protein [Mesobacillus selenatarsenatis]|uniref:Uncharacterized protein n=1 Tax=Mesobacillus selenatarsenatis (strain DSM 18680 / JCM 14380 / FERM P-15431 / SF-1) TaxID=1321606 RepID=A0A0A8X2Z5_MESS1|nr:hypothetical protein [Mesobacillus selenatarsenatis]GAM13649.1 hypothetical protein SAMD00020551_1795 [Mesobacillus selenatarsenatis SF-1]